MDLQYIFHVYMHTRTVFKMLSSLLYMVYRWPYPAGLLSLLGFPFWYPLNVTQTKELWRSNLFNVLIITVLLHWYVVYVYVLWKSINTLIDWLIDWKMSYHMCWLLCALHMRMPLEGGSVLSLRRNLKDDNNNIMHNVWVCSDYSFYNERTRWCISTFFCPFCRHLTAWCTLIFLYVFVCADVRLIKTKVKCIALNHFL